jgi:hypothetical protein
MPPPARTLESWVRIPLEAWMFVCVCFVFVLSWVSSGLATGWSPVQGVLPTVYKYKIKEHKRRPRPDIVCKRHWMGGRMEGSFGYSQKFGLIFSQMNPFHTFTPCLLKVHFDSVLPSVSQAVSSLYLFWLILCIVSAFLISHHELEPRYYYYYDYYLKLAQLKRLSL